jgi:lysophospholipase L1-like esterase
MRYRNTSWFLLLFVLLVSFVQVAERPVCYIMGDSTVKNGDGKSTNQLQGWGSFLPDHFDTVRIALQNHAIGGRSSRTFLTEGRWDKIKQSLKAKDYVLIQFGHNDSGPLDDTARARGTLKGVGEETKDIYNPIRKRPETVHTYGWYLRKYIREAKELKAIPIICSPIPRNDWKEGKMIRSEATYTSWARQVAQEEGAFFIDLHNVLADEYEKLGKAKADTFFPVEHTHTGKEGALFNASIVAREIAKLNDCDLKHYMK